MDPATAAAAFYTRMLHIADWQTLAPTLVAHAVQINADPNHYAPFWASAEHVLAALTGASAGTCRVPADARAAAAVLVGAIQVKKLNFLELRYQQQVIDMADGTATPACTIDAHVLQLIVVAVRSFQQVGVSDLNRRCTGMTPAQALRRRIGRAKRWISTRSTGSPSSVADRRPAGPHGLRARRTAEAAALGECAIRAARGRPRYSTRSPGASGPAVYATAPLRPHGGAFPPTPHLFRTLKPIGRDPNPLCATEVRG
ncbi:hypothetical protein ASE16_03190 [Leifsonia sp. Root227]|nr:hypothetical protein ASE16_03190 [Leifsonia sp. Root227]